MIRTAQLQYRSDERFTYRDAGYLRGFFGNKYREEDLFHNHTESGAHIFRMPRIQYHVINGALVITGYNEGVAPLAEKFLHVKRIELMDRLFENFEVKLLVDEAPFEVCNELFTYRLISPWLPVTQKNHTRFIKGELDLDVVMRNNILTNFKGLGITADKTIMVKGTFRPGHIMLKGIHHHSFTGTFTTNVNMPDLMTHGRFRSIGYGCVRRDL